MFTVIMGILLTGIAFGGKNLGGGMVAAALLWGAGYIVFINLSNWGWL
jgi:hypothetical protein